MSLTNLTGTTWTFDDVINLPNENKSFNIDFTLSSGDLYDSLDYNSNFISYGLLSSFTSENISNTSPSGIIEDEIEFEPEEDDLVSIIVYYGGQVPYWMHNDFKTITITGGLDVENPELINFLRTYAISKFNTINKIQLPNGNIYKIQEFKTKQVATTTETAQYLNI